MLYKNIKKINAKIIKTLIDNSGKRHKKVKELYERYKGSDEGVPILTRIYEIDGEEQKDKINNKLANDFFSEIIDMKVGFFCGVPITYELNKNKYITEQVIENSENEEEETEEILNDKYDTDLEHLERWLKYNQIADLDSETSKMASICGYVGRLFYMDKIEDEPIVKSMLLDSWELIFIGDSIEEAEAVIRYYQVYKYDAKGEKEIEDWAELYTDSEIKHYKKEKKNDKTAEYILQKEEKHPFSRVPIIGFANNKEMLGDAEKVLTLIDGYDRTISDVNSELEQFRLAYLKFLNCSIPDSEIQKARQTGAFNIPGENADVDFITKTLDDNIIEHHLDRIERNVYRFSKTPNFNDISFSGNLTGVAMKYKFIPFENKCIVAELKFEKASNQQFKLLCDIWKGRGATIDYLDIDLQFTRNYPQNLVEEIQMLRDSKGIISEETRFSLVSFISDPQDEIEKLKAEERENLDSFVERNEALGGNTEEDTNAFSNRAKEE